MKTLKILIFLIPALVFGTNAKVDALFSSEDQLAERLIGLIDQEKGSIKVAIYAMTHRGIADALVRAQERGVAVAVIVDPFAVKKRSSVHRLIEGKIPLYVWDKGVRMGQEGKRKGLMHDKFCVFGAEKTWTGSFNFTYDAERRHQENVVVIDSKEIAQKYLDVFSRMQLYESRPYLEYVGLYAVKKSPKKSENKVS